MSTSKDTATLAKRRKPSTTSNKTPPSPESSTSAKSQHEEKAPLTTKANEIATVFAEAEKLIQSTPRRFATLGEKDPVRYLEARRLDYLKRLEIIADDAAANQQPELELKALAFAIRLTSVYKSRVDVTSSNLGLIKEPDLSHLSTDQIAALERADEEALKRIAPTLLQIEEKE